MRFNEVGASGSVAWCETTTSLSLAVDHLATVLGLHSGAKTELAGTLDLARSSWVMHRHGEKSPCPMGNARQAIPELPTTRNGDRAW